MELINSKFPHNCTHRPRVCDEPFLLKLVTNCVDLEVGEESGDPQCGCILHEC